MLILEENNLEGFIEEDIPEPEGEITCVYVKLFYVFSIYFSNYCVIDDMV